MTKKTYISRQDAVNSGMTKKNGVFYKKSLLEIWHTKGWLEYKNSKYGADDRLRFGMRLALDCHIANRENLHAGYIFNNKVDISAKVESSALLEVKDRYYKAVHAVPAEFWPIVRQICIDEKEPEAPQMPQPNPQMMALQLQEKKNSQDFVIKKEQNELKKAELLLDYQKENNKNVLTNKEMNLQALLKAKGKSGDIPSGMVQKF